MHLNNNSEILSAFREVACTETELYKFYNNQLQLKQGPYVYNVLIVRSDSPNVKKNIYQLQHINDEKVWAS